MIIALSGLHGTGKSSVGKKLAERLQINYYSTGQAFRELAKEYGMSLEEFTHHVENYPSIDKKLDNKIIEIAKKGDILIESQLSGFLLKEIANHIILLTCPLETRVKRIAERDNLSHDEALKETLLREASELERFKKLYDFDLEDQMFYDLIVDTSNLTIDETIHKILEFITSDSS